MARVFSVASGFFSAAFVILLVLGAIAVGNVLIADEPLPSCAGEQCGDGNEPCNYEKCGGGSCGCCYCKEEGQGSCFCFLLEEQPCPDVAECN